MVPDYERYIAARYSLYLQGLISKRQFIYEDSRSKL